MKSIHSLIFIIPLIFVISCDTTDDPTPDESPDLPVITDFQVAQNNWVPNLITVYIDTVSNILAWNASNQDSYWYFTLDLNDQNQTDLTDAFEMDNTTIAFPDKFLGTYGLKDSSSQGPAWFANKTDELISLIVSNIYDVSGKKYCSGYLAFQTSGEVNPKTLRVVGSFENVRLFHNEQDLLGYTIERQMELRTQ